MAAATAELGTRVPRKAKLVLDRLVGSRAMTKEGMEWLICATDPFHDDRVRCPGYPDLSTVNSVVQTYTTTTSVAAPAGVGAAWDLHIPFIPATPCQVSTGSGAGFNQYTMTPDGAAYATGTGPIIYGGWNLLASKNTGLDWYTSASSNWVSSSAVSIPTKYCSGHYRLVATGIEVVNTTAELYKGGSITCYRAPSSIEQGMFKWPQAISASFTKKQDSQKDVRSTSTRDSQMESGEVDSPLTVLPATFFLPVPVKVISLPPTTQAEAAIFTDSRTWAAEDGCYIIAAQTTADNDYDTLKPSDVLVKKTFDSATVIADINAPVARNIWTSIGPYSSSFSTAIPALAGISQATALPFECCGTIVVSLNPNATIQVSTRYYFERIPATTESDLLSMCQVPPAFDGVALEIYSRCLAEMPVGVPVSENPLGEWFNSVLDTIKSVAPKIGGIVSGVGRAITEIGGTPPVQSNATPQRKQNKQQKKQFKQSAQKMGPNLPRNFRRVANHPQKPSKKQRKRNGKA